MDQIQKFAFDGAAGVRVISVDDEPWFVAKDVAEALEYTWNGNSRIEHVPEEWRRVTSVVTLRGDEQDMAVLSEQGLYFFLARSDKPKALPFQKWVAGTVLPSIRKHDGYIAGQETMSREQFLAKAVLMSDSIIKEQKALIEKHEQKIALDAPKVEAFEVLMASDKDVCITLAAQHFGLKPKLEVFPYLRSKGYLKGKDLPTQTALDEGFLVKKVITNTATNEIIGEQARVGLDQYEAWRTKLVPRIKEYFHYN